MRVIVNGEQREISSNTTTRPQHCRGFQRHCQLLNSDTIKSNRRPLRNLHILAQITVDPINLT